MTGIVSLLLAYRYWVIVPLSIVEGPIVAFVGGTLAATGFLSLWWLIVLFFISDMAKDGFYYALGHYGTKWRLTQKILSKIGVTEEHFKEVRRVWETHPLRTMFFGKIAYGIATGFIVLAGAIEMRLATFFTYGAIVTVLQYGFLLFVGFFFGNVLGATVPHLIQNIQYAIAGIAAFIVLYYLFSMRVKRHALKEEQDILSHEEK